ncbi:MAG: sigma-70 family RNA polymerase sigma factor [Bacteroidota bacterium]
MDQQSEITQLLIQLNKGKNVYDQLYPMVYNELRKLAYMRMSWEATDHTFSKTELVHEAYMKMVNQNESDFSDRSHFLAIASRCMRQILIDHARKKKAQKRGGNKKDATYIDELFDANQQKSDELINIDEALDRLAQLNKRLSDVVEMRFFGEMTIEETAEALGVSKSTVKREWVKARGWLYKELKGRFEIS